jgi:cytoskeletal protein CcmA (bactofilin family)
MFKSNGLFGSLEDAARKDPRSSAPPQGHNTQPAPRPPYPEPTKLDAAAARVAGDVKGSKLIVGPDIKLKGAEITDCDTLVVEGRVEAAMDSRVIQIASQGVFCGTAGIDVAEIHGRFEGELTARKQLVIHATGKVSGKIRYGKLTIEEGGELSGDIGALTAADPLTRKDRPPVVAKPVAGLV